ncbi:hypothetical protein IE077_003339 [Cardiosporidium cionae]|uniref:RRM domain-containing protein n=1 Tax=Cardiosporidium cionae TaxID=476202 RepID=A0ABQ7JFG1_9APIC|nr:hypothetical protein IE077_003339 [Cardiosporidium cionae]|eukprot:KAF8822614.1 hypothetical protein IE077_003339 [Cardiosporidium cionae]
MRGETYEDGKIFVGGLSQESTKESMRRHFAEFGNITDCVVMVDNATGRSRGFGFVTFDNAEAIDAVLASKQMLDGKEVGLRVACSLCFRLNVLNVQSVYGDFHSSLDFVIEFVEVELRKWCAFFE